MRFVVIMISLILLAACSPKDFKAEKIATLKTSNVFSENEVNDSGSNLDLTESDGSKSRYPLSEGGGSQLNLPESGSSMNRYPLSEGSGSRINLPEISSLLSRFPLSEGSGSTANVPLNEGGSSTAQIPLAEGGSSTAKTPLNEGGSSTAQIPLNEGSSNPLAERSTYTNGVVSINAQRVCSNLHTSNRGTNVMGASTLQLRVLDKDDNVICSRSDTAQIKSEILNGHAVISGCSLAQNKNYHLSLLADGNIELVKGSDLFTVNSNGQINVPSIQVLVDANPNKNSGPTYAGATCDVTASPLYVDFRSDRSQAGNLSSPFDGVWFDILGANGSPAYSKNQISWFKSAQFALLALPNAQGEVEGVDQLFGNNTLGKDGAFADNGFLALAKYDDNKDGIIDSKDAVFSKLRLWFDYDLDGISRSRELASLKSRGIVMIDLEYDPNYYERDQYGNEIKYKSVVQFASGKLRSIFDVWFRL